MKFIALAFSCLFILSMPANANEADTFNAMVALANKGDAEAQYHVGMMHNNGIGTPKDPKQAFEWFQKSAASNFAPPSLLGDLRDQTNAQLLSGGRTPPY